MTRKSVRSWSIPEAAKKPAKLAVSFLKGIVSALPSTAQLAEACTKLLPMITSLLGL